LENSESSADQPAIRLGMREVRGFPEDAAKRIATARDAAPFFDVTDLCNRARLNRREQSLLAEAGDASGFQPSENRVREYFARLINADVDEIAFVPSTQIGEQLAWAPAIALIPLVTPGPAVSAATPSRRVALAKPSAANTADCS